MYNLDITQVFIALIGLIGVVITSVVVPFFKSKTTAQLQETIKSIVSVAVYAAQQMFAKEESAAKKAYALQQIKTVLMQWHIELTDEEITTYIEGVLKDIKTSLADDDKAW